MDNEAIANPEIEESKDQDQDKPMSVGKDQ